jgi:hypothetical protein
MLPLTEIEKRISVVKNTVQSLCGISQVVNEEHQSLGAVSIPAVKTKRSDDEPGQSGNTVSYVRVHDLLGELHLQFLQSQW